MQGKPAQLSHAGQHWLEAWMTRLANGFQTFVQMGPSEEMHWISQPSSHHHMHSQLKQKLHKIILTLL